MSYCRRRWRRRDRRNAVIAVIAGVALAVLHQAAAPGPGPSLAAGAGAVTGTGPAASRAAGQRLAASMYGWTAGQFSCLDWLWTRESGWRRTATNPQSGAFGIPQSLHGDIGGFGGNEFSAADPQGLTPAQLRSADDGNAADQEIWGLRYIASVYGTPCGAWAHEQSAGWY
jgi:hypothetical protein